MIRAIIVEDEVKNQKFLSKLLNDNCPDVNITGTYAEVKEAINAIKKNKPQLVFLDIQLKDGSGFDVLSKLDEYVPKIIFTTAYDQYAIKAFKYSAIDYLLKPIIIEELKQAVAKVGVTGPDEEKISIKSLLQQISSANSEPVISVSGIQNIDYIKVSNILRLEGLGAYSKITTLDGEVFMVSKVLKEYEGLLKEHDFFRVHQSHIINLKKIKRYKKGDHLIILSDGAQIPVSRNKKEPFLLKMRQYIIS